MLRTLIEAEIIARDASNAAARLKAATFPAPKTVDGFDVAASRRSRSTTAPRPGMTDRSKA